MKKSAPVSQRNYFRDVLAHLVENIFYVLYKIIGKEIIIFKEQNHAYKLMSLLTN